MRETATTDEPWRITVASDSWIGHREHNEDTLLLRPDLGLYVLADGAGGENAGNVASALATTSVAHHFEETLEAAANGPDFDALGLSTGARRVSAAIQRANRDIVEIARTSKRHHGMGTTVVVASIDNHRGLLHLGHVGDSRCYRIRDGRIELLTQDHTLINDVLELEPNIDDERASRLPRNVITRALGMAKNIRASVRSFQLAPKDRYLMCSDGLTDEVSERAILDAIEVGGTPEDIVRVLMGLAREAEAEDNVAVVVIGCELAPGISSLPKPAPTQGSPGIRERDETRQFNVADVRAAPPPPPKVPRTERATRDSDYPEILIVGHGNDDSSPEIHIVPSGPTDPGMLDAVQSFIERTRTYPPSSDPEGSWEDGED